MPPRFLINKHTKTVWDYTPDLATNKDLEPFYGEGEETARETAVAAVEVAPDDDEMLVDPVTGELIVEPPPVVAGKKGK